MKLKRIGGGVRPAGGLERRGVRDRGLTRLDVVAVVAALGLLFAVTWPVLAGGRERSLRVVCVENLRQVGRAFQQWGLEREGNIPWRTPWCESGTMPSTSSCSSPGLQLPVWLVAGFNRNPWFQYYWVSNELRTPSILACPSDSAKSPALHWGGESTGGFLNGRYQNRAVSYFLGLDVRWDDPLSLLSGDRNIQFGPAEGACSSGIPYNAALRTQNSTARFNSALHADAGNLLFTDGHVEELSSQGFRRRLAELNPAADVGILHFLNP